MTVLTGNQLRAARALVGVDQQYIARTAGININTVRNMEARGFKPVTSGAMNVERVRRSLEVLGVEFLEDEDPSFARRKSGVALRSMWADRIPPSREGKDWRVGIYRDGDDGCLLAIQPSRAREMAGDARQRGDTEYADTLDLAAWRAEYAAEAFPPPPPVPEE
jgi:hypothetical protein